MTERVNSGSIAVPGLPPIQERISRRARAIRLEVRADGEVRLVIPAGASRAAAHAFLRSRTAWVQQHLAQLQRTHAARPPPQRLRWDDTDTLPLHGQTVPLRYIPTPLSAPQVRVDHRGVAVLAPPRTAVEAGDLALTQALTQALRALARDMLSDLLRQESQTLRVDFQGPRIGDQRSRWGSCSARGAISLSWRLIFAPPEVQRYVVVHELCHRRHFDHSEGFWRLVGTRVPEYASHRAWLRRHGAALHRVLPRPGYDPS